MVAGALTLADLYDGIHPSAVANEKVGGAWLDAIEPLLQ